MKQLNETHADVARIIETESPEKWGLRMTELLAQRDAKLMEEIERKRKEDRMIYATTTTEVRQRQENKIFNSALDDILALLSSKNEN